MTEFLEIITYFSISDVQRKVYKLHIKEQFYNTRIQNRKLIAIKFHKCLHTGEEKNKN